MKRRNTKKCGSFDYIRVITPKKQQPHGYSLNLQDPNQSCLSPTLHLEHRGRHYLELPKIHAVQANKIRRG